MHERTRRNLCRLTFLALGVLPTLGTLAWAGYRASPHYAAIERSAWEHRLSELTGLLTAIGRIEHPTSGTLLFHELTLTDPDGGDRVARVRQVWIAPRPEGIVVELSQPEVDQGKFLRIWDALHHRVLHGPAPSTAVQMTTRELTLEVGQRAQTFKNVLCTMTAFESKDARSTDRRQLAGTANLAGSVKVAIDFQLAGFEMSTPARLILERNRLLSPPMTRWTLQTQVPLPCAIFTDYLPHLSRLGNRALFHGNLSIALDRTTWTGQLAGQFLQVDLDQLTELLPHKLSGTASVTIHEAILERGVLRSASGAVVSERGTVGLTLISALVEQMSLDAPDVMLASGPLAQYDQLAIEFEISASGFSVAGLNPNDRDTLLTARGKRLLSGDSRARYPLVALVRALTPDSQYLVPATEATKPLINFLDLPAPRPAAVPGDRPHSIPLRWSKRAR